MSAQPSDGGSAVRSLPRVAVSRYVTPLREGGSLPGVVEGDDLGTYVCKFRGAGQGARVLVAEVIVSGLAQRLGLRTPSLVELDLDPEIARFEADEEVQDLLNASAGPNLGIDFLPGAFGFDPHCTVPGEEQVRVLWLDAFTANVDRSWRNPNLLVWHEDLWLIDHGASLYFHHGWRSGVGDPQRFAGQRWDPTGHVFESRWPDVAAAHEAIAGELSREDFTEVVAAVPDAWLEPVPGTEGADALRAAYVEFLTARLGSGAWLPERRQAGGGR